MTSLFKKGIKEATSELSREIGIERDDVSKALSTSKKPVQRLGQGLHNNCFYYGTTLSYEGKPISAIVTKDKKPIAYLGLNYIDWTCQSCGFETQTIQPSYEKIKPPKICECKKVSYQDWKITGIFNPIKNDFGLNYRTEFNDEAIDYSWQTESIREYLEQKYKKKSLKEIYENLVSINKKYIDHLNPTSHKYVACCIIGTYCYTLFEQFGRLYNRAEKGSGKTKQARIIKFTCHNPIWITKGSESAIFRDAEATCGTFIIDNMDKLHEELKRIMEHQIETGWMYDSTFRLTNRENEQFKTTKFLSYTPMIINNILGLDENTIDKVFEIPMLKSINNSIKRAKPTSKSENWEGIRNSIRYWMLDNWEQVQKTYEKIIASFSGREFDVVESVLTIAKLLGDDVFDEMESFVKAKIEENLLALEDNPAYLVFSNIWEIFKDSPTPEKNIFLKDIADELFFKFYPNMREGTKEYDNTKRNFSRYVGKIIRAVPMFRKSGMSNGKTYISVKLKELQQYMQLQHFINDNDVLLTSITSTTSTGSTTSTLKKVEQVEQVEQESEVEQNNQNGKLKVTYEKIGAKNG